MATAPSTFPFFTASPPFSSAATYPPPIPYPNPIQINGGYYPPPPYLAGHGRAPPTFPELPSALGSTPPQPPRSYYYTDVSPAPASGWPPPAPDPTPYATSYPCSYPPSAAAYHSAPPILEPPNTGAPANSVLPDHDSSWSPALHTPNRDFYPSSSAAYTPDHLPDQAAPQIDAYQNPFFPGGYSTLPYAATCYCPTCVATQIPTHVDPNHLPPAPTTIHGDVSLLSNLLGRHKRQQHTEEGSELEEDGSMTTRYDCPLKIKMSSSDAHRVFPDLIFQEGYSAKGTDASGASINNTKFASGISPQSSSATTVSTFSSSLGATATVSVAPKVLDEMPTPCSGYETYCYGHPNPVQSSSVQGERTNCCDRYVDDEPQSYGFHNLISQSVFLADGTEHRYYALPDDCLTKSEQKSNFGTVKQSICDMLAQIQAQLQTMLKRCETKQPVEANTVGPAPVLCSKSNITTDSESLVHDLQPPTAVVQDNPNGLKEMLVSDVSQDGKQETEQLLQRCSKAPETTQTTTCLTYISDVQDFTLELQQKDDEKTSVNVQQLRAPPWNLLVTHERRKAWDPGEHTILSSTPTRRIVGFQEASILSRISIFKLNDVLAVRTIFGVTNCCVPQQCYCSVPSSKENHRVLFLWDPGILRQSTFSLQQQDDDRAGDYSVLKGSYSFATRSNQLITEHIKRELRLLWDPGALSYLQSMGSSDTAAMLCCPPGILIQQRRNSAALLHFSKYILLGSVVCLWDPGASAHLQSSMDSATVTLQQLPNKSISSLEKSSLEKERRVQWDPGVPRSLHSQPYILTVSDNIYSYCLVVRHNSDRSIHSTKKIMLYFMLSLVVQEKEMLTRLCPRSWSSIFQPMQSSACCQYCRALSYQFYWHQDIKFSGLSVWLINFNPP